MQKGKERNGKRYIAQKRSWRKGRDRGRQTERERKKRREGREKIN